MTFWQAALGAIIAAVLITVVPYSIALWSTAGRLRAMMQFDRERCDDPDCPEHGDEE